MFRIIMNFSVLCLKTWNEDHKDTWEPVENTYDIVQILWVHALALYPAFEWDLKMILPPKNAYVNS